MMYGSENAVTVPNVDLLTFLFDFEESRAKDDTPLHAEASDPSQVLTKADARLLSKQFAYFLRHKYGIGQHGPGKDVVTVVSSGQSRLPCLFYGVVAAEGVYSAAAATAASPDLVQRFKDGPTKVVVCSKDVEILVSAAAEEAGLPLSSVLILESAPKSRLYSVDGSAECDLEKCLDWRRITDPAELEQSIVCILYSSGTTGVPKGARISHANMVAQCYIPSTMNRPVWAKWTSPFESRTLAHLPPMHISGVQGYFVNPFFDAGLVYWMPKMDFVQFMRYNATLRITSFFTVPTIYVAIANLPMVTDQFASLQAAYCGGAPLRQAAQTMASKKLGGGTAQIVRNWGMTEATGAATHLAPDRTDDTGSVSTLMPGITMRLVDNEGGDVGPGELGEALLKGPVITKGYHNNPTANKAMFTEDGWMRTGDILRVKGDLLYLIDRKKDVIQTTELIYPGEVEEVLVTHQLISDAAVAAVRSAEDDRTLLRAYVALKPQAKDSGLSAEDVRTFVDEKVSDSKKLTGGVVFISAIPRNPAGKLLRHELEGATKV